MAKFNPGSIISEIRGSVGDVTYSKNHYGPYSKQKLTQTVTNTDYQLLMRNALRNGVLAYQQLTDQEYLEWSTFVNQREKSFTISRKQKQAAFNEYISRYINAACIGVSPGVIPVDPENDEFSFITGINQTPTEILVDFFTPMASGTNYVAIYASEPMSQGIRAFNPSKCNLIGYTIVHGGGEAIDIATMYLARYPGFGNGIPSRIAVAIKNINAESFSAGNKSFSSIVTDGTFPPLANPGYQNILDAATDLGITLPSGNNQIAGNQLYTDLENLGVINNCDLLYILAGGANGEFGLLNWRDPYSFQLTPVGTPVYTPLLGWKGSVGNYFTTGYIPSVNGVRYQQNNASMFSYLMQDNVPRGNDIGCISGGSVGAFHASYNDASITGASSEINTFIAFSAVGNTTIPRFVMSSRTSSTSQRIRINALSPVTQAGASAARPNFELYVFARNDSGSVTNESSNVLSVVGVSNNLDSLSTSIQAAMDTYLNALT